MVDHVTLDCVMPTLSAAAQLVLLRIYRQTVGWKRERDRISLSQFKKFTGYKTDDTIISAVRELESKRMINVLRIPRKTNEYSLVWETIGSFALLENLE